MSIHEIASDDVVRSHDDVGPDGREPLLVLDPLLAFLDSHGLGAGEPQIEPIGDGHSNVTYALHARRRALRATPPAARPAAAERPRRAARGARAGRARRAGARPARCSPSATTRR